MLELAAAIDDDGRVLLVMLGAAVDAGADATADVDELAAGALLEDAGTLVLAKLLLL